MDLDTFERLQENLYSKNKKDSTFSSLTYISKYSRDMNGEKIYNIFCIFKCG